MATIWAGNIPKKSNVGEQFGQGFGAGLFGAQQQKAEMEPKILQTIMQMHQAADDKGRAALETSPGWANALNLAKKFQIPMIMNPVGIETFAHPTRDVASQEAIAMKQAGGPVQFGKQRVAAETGALVDRERQLRELPMSTAERERIRVEEERVNIARDTLRSQEENYKNQLTIKAMELSGKAQDTQSKQVNSQYAETLKTVRSVGEELATNINVTGIEQRMPLFNMASGSINSFLTSIPTRHVEQPDGSVKSEVLPQYRELARAAASEYASIASNELNTLATAIDDVAMQFKNRLLKDLNMLRLHDNGLKPELTAHYDSILAPTEKDEKGEMQWTGNYGIDFETGELFLLPEEPGLLSRGIDAIFGGEE